jgi:uncharacterized protein (DUF305 family)
MFECRFGRAAAVAVLVVAAGASACTPAARRAGVVTAPAVVQAGAPGEASRAVARGERFETAPIPHTDADVRFLRDMILHHEQALEMTGLVPDRAARDDVRRLALRIEMSQNDEIAMMRRWLERRGESAADPHAHHRAHDGMPGMLTAAQMASLRAARGAEFDRLFLELMILHHEGALLMVEQLLASEGAAQDPEIFQMASHIDADQRAEMERMRRLLAADG